MKPDSTENETPLILHLRELRGCLIKVMLTLIVTTGLSLAFSKDLFNLLSKPLQRILPGQSYFIATHPIEAWLTYFKTALLAGLFAATPILFYQLWKFISPGLYASEKKLSLLFTVFSTLLFAGGALFGYFYVFPLGFQYFVGVLAGTDIHFLPRMEDYLGFAFKMLLAFGVSFELPLVIFFLHVAGLVTVKGLMAFQKYVVVLILIVAAILTPPDVISQTLLAIPLMALYEVGVVVVFFRERIRNRMG